MDMKQRRVMIAIPDMQFGGSERATAEIANYLAGEGVDVSVLIMYDREVSYELDSKVNLIRPARNFNKLLNLFYLIVFIRAEVKKHSPDTVLAMGYKTFIILACMGLPVRLVDSLRTSATRIRFPGNQLLNLIYMTTRKLIRWRVDGVIAQTERAKRELEKTHTCRIEVIPNSLRKIESHNVERDNIVLSVGRLSVEKGHRYLMDAYAKSLPAGWRLMYVGDGPQRENLEKQAEQLGISGSVQFEGFQANVDYYMQRAKIFVLPSLIEGFPNALVEAMANGLACISSDCDSGPAEIIDHGINGYLSEPENSVEMAHYLTLLTSNSGLRTKMGENATSVKEKYDIRSIGDRYSKFLLQTNR